MPEMPEKLVCSNNSLADLIKWSKWGYIIMLTKKITNTASTSVALSRPEFINSNKIVKIILSSQWHCLMDEGEWVDYLIESGCKKMKYDDYPNLYDDHLNLDKKTIVEFSM